MASDIKVKLCEKCGVLNSDDDTVCEACGTKLGEAVSNDDADKIIADIAKKKEAIERAKRASIVEDYEADNIEEIPTTPFGKVIGVLSYALIAAYIVLFIVGLIKGVGAAGAFFIWDLLMCLFLVFNAVSCFNPTLGWRITHLGYIMHYKKLPEPSDIGFVMIQISYILFLIVGIAGFGFQLYFAF